MSCIKICILIFYSLTFDEIAICINVKAILRYLMKYLQYYKNSDADSPEDLVLKSLEIQGNSERYFLDMQGKYNVDVFDMCSI